MNTIHVEPETSSLHRLPGLFRRWELAQIIEAGDDYHIEDAGAASDGTPLYAVYRHRPDEPIVARAEVP
jgi:hypothetical protein